jgi:ABC-type uncharacterized transport system permease subunit
MEMLLGVLHLFPIIAVLSYCVATWAYIRGLIDAEQSISTYKLGRSSLVVGFTCHVLFILFEFLGLNSGVQLENDIFELQNIISKLNFPFSLSLLSMMLIGLFLFLENRMRISVLGGFLAPLGVLFMVFSGVLFHINRETNIVSGHGVLLWFHVGCAVLANVFLVFAFVVSVIVIIQESQLKKKQISNLHTRMPSLQELDRFSSLLITTGFLLMTIGVSTGFVFAYLSNVSFFQFDSRVIWSLLTFIIYAFLVLVRVNHGWRGRRAAWLAVLGFSTLVASFIGVNIVGQTFHVY